MLRIFWGAKKKESRHSSLYTVSEPIPFIYFFFDFSCFTKCCRYIYIYIYSNIQEFFAAYKSFVINLLYFSIFSNRLWRMMFRFFCPLPSKYEKIFFYFIINEYTILNREAAENVNSYLRSMVRGELFVCHIFSQPFSFFPAILPK